MELTEFQCECFMKEKYSEFRIPEFYSCLLARLRVEMLNFLSKIISVFDCTFFCDQVFSFTKADRRAKISSSGAQNQS
jgi:hypothetical protein